MKKLIKLLMLFFFLFTVGFAYWFGKQGETTEYVYSRNDEELSCPYETEGGIYTEYATLANELTVSGKPQLIDNPEVIKMDEPFNLQEFEKDLYKLSTDKGWSETAFDVDADGIDERIISANVAMNHTPHIAMILKGNNIIFEANGANIVIEPDYMGRGFTLSETVDWNIGESKKTRYIPKDGGFMPVWMQKSCWVDFK